jgi:hypothetical protein
MNLMPDFGCGVDRVDGHHPGAGAQSAEPRQGKFDGIRQRYCQSLAWAKACERQAGSDALHAIGQLAIANTSAALSFDERRLVAMPSRSAQDNVNQGCIRILQRRPRAPENHARNSITDRLTAGGG